MDETKNEKKEEKIKPQMGVPKIPKEFLVPYDPQRFEDDIYKLWEDSGYFNPDVCVKDAITAPDAEPFSIVLPPPNVTGVLHIGHAYEDSLQDAFVRFERMCRKKALWIPGTDSAAISTQARVEKNLQKDEGKSRHDIGRAELVKRINAFAKESENTIVSQVKKLGNSLDWSRYAYTLDEPRNLAVFTAFKRMYHAGLIYRGNRIVNWDPKGQTTISDDEIVYEEEVGKFYYFQYGPFTIGTSRPETKFGDKYVVVHPDDERYKQYAHEQKIELEWINGPITATVIKDVASDPEMGSGAMTITPWHSMIDFEIAERHGLDKEQIIDQYGKLLPIAGEFAGMNIAVAREKIVEKLKEKGLLVKVEEDYVHNLATAERTGATIEPQIMEQWFVAVNKSFVIPHSEIPGITSGSSVTLRDVMHAAVESGAVDMPQEGFKRAYFHWVGNLHDWCISRQIWFGHQIPVWYRTVDGKNEMYCDITPPEGDGWEQDSDVLDTWFSSALWTFSTLGWPNETPDLKNFHPNALISPGYEILYLWISRMILMSGFHLGQAPFRTVLIHGIVRDKLGRKFSKSLGNGIDPLEMIQKHGADALRMGLLVGTSIGNDITFDENKVRGYKHFANKLWNIARFVLENYDGSTRLPPEDRNLCAEIIELQVTIDQVSLHIETFRLDLAADSIYHFVWDRFAAEIIEEFKLILKEGSEGDRKYHGAILYEILLTSLKLLHPFMPFVTEAIWQRLPKEMKNGERDMLMVAEWPTPDKK